MEPAERDDPLMELIDQHDARGGSRVLKSKAYSIEKLRKEGYPDEEIELLLNIRLRS